MIPTKILLVDDQELFRCGLVMLLEDEADMELVGETASGHESVELAQSSGADVVVMDVNLPDLSGVDASRAIKSRSVETKVLILTAHDTEEYLLKARDSGADGFLLKQSAAEKLVDAIRYVWSGGVYVDELVQDAGVWPASNA